MLMMHYPWHDGDGDGDGDGDAQTMALLIGASFCSQGAPASQPAVI